MNRAVGSRRSFALVSLVLLTGLVAAPGLILGYTTISGSLGLSTGGNGYQRDFRVFDNFLDPAANNNDVPDFSFPGALGAPQAIVAAWAGLGGALAVSDLTPAETRGDWQWYTAVQPAGSHFFERAPRARRVYYPRAGALEPAYHVELLSRARANGQLSAYALVVSAADGRVLHRANLKADAAFTKSTAVNTYVVFDFETQVGMTLPAAPIRWVRFEVDTRFGTPPVSRNWVGLSEIQFNGDAFVAIPAPAANPTTCDQ